MTELSFTPTFHHTEWVDNVDRIQAGGPNGFNVRLNAIEADLHQVSTVVSQIDAAIDELGTGAPPPRQVRLSVALQMVSPLGSVISPAAGWFYDSTGALLPDAGHRGASAVMDLTLPDKAQLISFRVLGLYPGGSTSLELSISRASIADPTRVVDVLGTVTSALPGLTNPYDVTMPIDSRFAVVDNGTFRYAFKAAANLFDSPVALTLAGLQILYNSP